MSQIEIFTFGRNFVVSYPHFPCPPLKFSPAFFKRRQGAGAEPLLPLKWQSHFKGGGFAALCASEPPGAVPATLAPRKVFFPTYTPPEKTIALFSRLRARTPAEGFCQSVQAGQRFGVHSESVYVLTFEIVTE